MEFAKLQEIFCFQIHRAFVVIFGLKSQHLEFQYLVTNNKFVQMIRILTYFKFYICHLAL